MELDTKALEVLSKEIKSEKSEKQVKSVMSKAELFLAHMYGPTTSSNTETENEKPQTETAAFGDMAMSDKVMPMSEEEFINQCSDTLKSDYGYTSDVEANAACVNIRDEMKNSGISFSSSNNTASESKSNSKTKQTG